MNHDVDDIRQGKQKPGGTRVPLASAGDPGKGGIDDEEETKGYTEKKNATKGITEQKRDQWLDSARRRR
jgi:hypothetical protein